MVCRSSVCCPLPSACLPPRCRRRCCCPRCAIWAQPMNWARPGCSPGSPWAPRPRPPPPWGCGRAPWVLPNRSAWWPAAKAGCRTPAWTAPQPSCPGERPLRCRKSRPWQPARPPWPMCALPGTPPTPTHPWHSSSWCSPCPPRSMKARAPSRCRRPRWQACPGCNCWRSPKRPFTTGWCCKANNWRSSCTAAAWCWWWMWVVVPPTSRWCAWMRRSLTAPVRCPSSPAWPWAST